METLKSMGLETSSGGKTGSNVFVDGLNISIKRGPPETPVFGVLMGLLGIVFDIDDHVLWHIPRPE